MTETAEPQSEETASEGAIRLYQRGYRDGFFQAVDRFAALLDADCNRLMEAAGWSRLKEPPDGDARGRVIRHLRFVQRRIREMGVT